MVLPHFTYAGIRVGCFAFSHPVGDGKAAILNLECEIRKSEPLRSTHYWSSL